MGFSTKTVALSRPPGWEPESWGYHGDDGNCYSSHNSGKQYGPPFTTGDTVGCGVNFRLGTVFFTKNGVLLGEPVCLTSHRRDRRRRYTDHVLCSAKLLPPHLSSAPGLWARADLYHIKGVAFREVKGKLFPSVGLKKTGEHIRANFGQTPFIFDIDGMMKACFNLSSHSMSTHCCNDISGSIRL